MDKPRPPHPGQDSPWLLFLCERTRARNAEREKMVAPPPFSNEECESFRRVVRAEWEAMSEDRRQQYEEEAERTRAQFPLDVAEYTRALAKWKADTIPPMPDVLPAELQAYEVQVYAQQTFFAEYAPMEKLHALMAEREWPSIAETTKRMQTRWNAMSVEERYPYLYEVCRDKQRGKRFSFFN
eukprot:GILJ01001522.1.p1 GENE.GILJ01001522.1~~GILJ01001522.1.p1  ORF type:complete len:183 (-),score=26.48 GILJ01001522.1:729-1277(-)